MIRYYVTLVMTTVCAASASAQSAAWPVSSSAQADLWFHGVATVGLGGPGRLPLYDSADVSRVRSAKHLRGVQTALDSASSRLGAALRADPAFEVLHFVPLLFSRSSPEEMLAELRRVADGSGSGGPGRNELFGSTAV